MQLQVGTTSVVQPQNVQPIIIQTTSQPAGRKYTYDSLLGRPIQVLGALQVTAGALCILFQIIAIVIHAAVADAGHGIWCGIFFIIAGAYGSGAGSTKKLCLIKTCMVMSIIAACFTVPLLTIAVAGLTMEEHNEYYYNDYEFDYSNSSNKNYVASYYSTNKLHVRKAMNGLLAGLALFEAVIAIISAALCCHGVCCCITASQGTVLSYPGQSVQYVPGQEGTSQGQMIIIQNTGHIQPEVQPTVIYPQAGTPNPGYSIQTTTAQSHYQQQQPQERGEPVQLPHNTDAPPSYPGGPVQPPQNTGAPPSYNPDYEKAPLPQQQQI